MQHRSRAESAWSGVARDRHHFKRTVGDELLTRAAGRRHPPAAMSSRRRVRCDCSTRLAESSGGRLVAILLAVAMITACGAEEGEVRHPILDAELPVLIDTGTPASPELGRIANRLRTAARVVELGALNEPREAVLGAPVSVVTTSSGEILVLDMMAGQVRVFGADGEFRRTLVGRGEGPLEITNPVQIELVAGGLGEEADVLVVLGRTTMKRFQLHDSTATLLDQFQPPAIPFPYSMCVNRDRVAIRSAAAREGNIVTVMDSKANAPSAFGDGYPHGGTIAREDLSIGPVACLPNGDIVTAFTYLPTVRAYGVNGQRRWDAAVPDFEPLTFREIITIGQGTRFSHSLADPGDMVQTLVAVAADAVLLQVARLAKSEQTGFGSRVQEIEGRRSYLISVATGRGMWLSDSLPHILAASDTMYWAGELGPGGFPRVAGYRY